jgi:hypothetical protein
MGDLAAIQLNVLNQILFIGLKARCHHVALPTR